MSEPQAGKSWLRWIRRWCRCMAVGLIILGLLVVAAKVCAHLEVDPIVRTKNERSFATPGPVVMTATLAVVGRLLLLAGHSYGTSRSPGETAAGSAGEQPAKG
jgi:hypothetical protein